MKPRPGAISIHLSNFYNLFIFTVNGVYGSLLKILTFILMWLLLDFPNFIESIYIFFLYYRIAMSFLSEFQTTKYFLQTCKTTIITYTSIYKLGRVKMFNSLKMGLFSLWFLWLLFLLCHINNSERYKRPQDNSILILYR